MGAKYATKSSGTVMLHYQLLEYLLAGPTRSLLDVRNQFLTGNGMVAQRWCDSAVAAGFMVRNQVFLAPGSKTWRYEYTPIKTITAKAES